MSVFVRIHRPPCVILADDSPCDKCRPAPAVSDPLIANVQVALARGRAILDREGYQWQDVSGNIPADANMVPGQLIEKVDGELGAYKAKLKDITYTITIGDDNTFTADAAITLQRLADD